jgi:hypothetical protein
MRLPRLGIGLVATGGLLALAVASIGPVSAHTTTSNTALTANSSYVSVTPARVADTRTSSPLAGGATLNVQVTGGTSGVPTGAVAAVLNVTAVNPTAAGFLTVFPEGTTMPTVSNLNFAAGTIVPNLVTVGLSATGMVSIYLNTGSTDVVVDVEGYYATPVTTSGLFNPLSPSRAFGSLTIGGAIGAGQTQAVTVAGTSATDGVPASASAVVLNVTAAHATLPSFLTVFPAGVSMPTASNLNFGAQAPLQAIANRVTVGVGTGGQIDVYNLTGTVNVDVDVDGYYSGTGGVGSPFVAITPIRVADTRTATKVGTENAIPAPPPQAAATETFTLATPDIPANAAGVAMNLTAVPGNKPGYLTSYPSSDTTPPVASDVNWTASESPAVPNFTIADTVGTGLAQTVEVANSYFTTGATVDVIADAFGYFAPSTAVGTYTVTGGQTLNYSTCSSVDGNPDISTSNGAGAVTYTASGFAAGATVDIALFPSTGSNAPTQPASFTPSSATGTSDAQGQGSTNNSPEEGLIVSVNGVPTGGTSFFDGFVAPSSGSFTFTVDSCSIDGTVPVVWTGPSTTLVVNANGTPATGYEVGIGNATTWTAPVAPSGDYTVYVQTIDPSTNTFQACTYGIGTCYTFTYGGAGSTYQYYASDTNGCDPSTCDYAIGEADFARYLSAASNPFTGDTGSEPTIYAGDRLYIQYNASVTSYFEIQRDIPGAATAVSATYSATTPAVTTDTQDPSFSTAGPGITVHWTKAVNPDVAYYDIYRAALTAGTYTFGNAQYVGDAYNSTSPYTPVTTTSFVDANSISYPLVAGTYEYEVVACDNSDNCGPLSAASNAVTVAATPVATVTGPVTTSTTFTNAASPVTTLGVGQTIVLNFNTPVTLAPTWTIEIVDGANNIAQLNAANTTATLVSGGLGLSLHINSAPVIVHGGALNDTLVWEVLQTTGIGAGALGTAPLYNVAGSGSATSAESSAATVTREITYNATTATSSSNTTPNTLPAAPTSVTVSSSTNNMTADCNATSDYLNVYSAAGTWLGSVHCAAATPWTEAAPTGVTFASGTTYQITESTVAAPVYNSQETITAEVLAS